MLLWETSQFCSAIQKQSIFWYIGNCPALIDTSKSVIETLEQCVNVNVIDVILVSLLLTLKTLSGVFILDFEQVSTSRVGSKICISITSYGLMKCHCLHLPSTHYINSVHIISNDIETSKTSVWI